jgi:predicted nucleic acid-binding protein
MIVVDASAIVAVLLGSARSAKLLERVALADDTLHAPHLIDVEVTHALRRYAMLRDLPSRQAQDAFQTFLALHLVRHEHRDLLPRVGDLRRNLTAYDAAYVALAEALDCPLLTCDARLARSSGHAARIQVLN